MQSAQRLQREKRRIRCRIRKILLLVQRKREAQMCLICREMRT